MSRTGIAAVSALAILLWVSCGGSSTDEEGLSISNTPLEQFARASQLYYRGRLSASLEEFNGVIYRFPDSPYAADARLAARRIESDLSGEEIAENNGSTSQRLSSRIAVVGRSAVSANVSRTVEFLDGTCLSITQLIDHQAPELTMVFYSQDFEYEASIVADSLNKWMLRPESISMRPGEELIEAVASGFDVLVIIGNDAVFEPSVN